MADIVDIAIREIDTCEKNNGHMKYINWFGGFGKGTRWCAIFVSWCANQAGVSTSVIKKFSSVTDGMNWFEKKGLLKTKGYIPQRGDIVFFCNNGKNHTGMVEKVTNNVFYTIEGNTSNKVARRNYPLSEPTLTGFGTPAYNKQSNQPTDNKAEKAKEELEYIKKINNYSKPIEKEIKVEKIILNKNEPVHVELLVDNSKDKFYLQPLDDVSLDLERAGTAGKLSFKAIIEKKFKIEEGNNVTLLVNGKKAFYGFVFTKSKDKENIITYTCYDQLRYLKNKDTIIIKNNSVDEIIKMIGDRFSLSYGKGKEETLEHAKYVMSRVEEDTTLLDIIEKAIEETTFETGEIYVFYDNIGKLTLKNIKNMKATYLIDHETAEDYSYQTSIDSNTYNQIKLVCQNENGVLDYGITKHAENINKWGVLQYYEKVDSLNNSKQKADALLKLYNQTTKTLSVKGAIGNILIRPGSLIPVLLDLHDITINHYMMVEKSTHVFSNGIYTMDLVLVGGGFSK